MMGLVFLVVAGLIFAAVWITLARRPRTGARLGPDATDAREPEPLVVRPGDPPPDTSHYDNKQVAPGPEPGLPNAELKERVHMEGPKGNRQHKPHKPGSPKRTERRGKSRHRDVELASELLPPAGAEGRVVRLRPDSPDRPDMPDVKTEVGELGALPEPVDWSYLGEEELNLPATYGWDRVIAMVRNPYSLYVYWELDKAGARLREMLGEAEWNRTTPCLRLFDVTPGLAGAPVRVIDIGPENDHWFINDFVEPGHRYIVSYERRTPEGRYYLLGHSDPTQLPYDRPAQQTALYRMYGRQPDGWQGSPWR